MLYLTTITIAVLITVLIYQIITGFPLRSKIRDKKRRSHRMIRERIKKENTEKIKELDNTLKAKGDIEAYITLNKYNLPEELDWQPILPEFIKELLRIGWTTEVPIYTTYKHGRYEIYLATSNQDLINKSRPVIHKYIDLYETL